LKDMLLKYLHLQYMGIARKGLQDNDLVYRPLTIGRRSHMNSNVICVTVNREVRTNSMYTKQAVKWNPQHGGYRIKVNNANWCVHPMLLLVRYVM
jgi:hypothetical protein